jgi:type IV secretion system protein VirB10
MTTAEIAPDVDIRPMVGRAQNNRSLWIFGGVMALAAIGLFSALEGRRSANTSPATTSSGHADGSTIASPPELEIPNLAAFDSYPFQIGGPSPLNTAPIAPVISYPTLPGVPNRPNLGGNAWVPPPPVIRNQPFYDAPSPEPQFVNRTVPDTAIADGDSLPALQNSAGGRATVTRLANPSTTIPQGALIQAVLETALDSNRPGFVRAIVSRDVRSFDGSKVLIPRGSRLFGEYKADLVDGQNRAFILWQKLTRPDGVQINVESPAADPLGRAGVKGSVNTHFFQRFAGSILQSALDIGVGIATRSASDGTVVIGLPGSSQTLINPSQSAIKPTLKVRHGSSVSVFVARDLDFTAAE